MNTTGRCSCSMVQYTLNRDPMFVHCCHCRQCQSLTGSAFVLNAIIEREAVSVTGDIHATQGPSEGGSHEIYRCTACQTALWSNYGSRRNYIFLRIGTLDYPGQYPPDVHIFTRSKLPWVTLPEGVPAFETFYDLAELWPAEAKERRRLALNGA